MQSFWYATILEKNGLFWIKIAINKTIARQNKLKKYSQKTKPLHDKEKGKRQETRDKRQEKKQSH